MYELKTVVRQAKITELIDTYETLIVMADEDSKLDLDGLWMAISVLLRRIQDLEEEE